MNATLDIPAFLDCKNPDVIKMRADARARPLPAITVRLDSARQQAHDEAMRAYLEGQSQTEQNAKKNSLAKRSQRKQNKATLALGARYDSTRGRWITPEEDLCAMARKIGKTAEEMRLILEQSGSEFGKKILSAIDRGKLALAYQNDLAQAERRARAAKKKKGVAPSRRVTGTPSARTTTETSTSKTQAPQQQLRLRLS